MKWMITRNELNNLRLTYQMMRLKRGHTTIAVLLGVLTLVFAIGLSVVAAWMIARASQIDTLWMDLAVAAVSVRMFGVGRALFRYMERLASHKVALLGVADLRHTVYKILASSPTENIARMRHGEILARTGDDIDSIGDFVVKSVLPATVTLLTAILTIIVFAFLSPLAALALAFCLFLAGVVGPLLTMRSARIAEIAAQQAQVELSASAQTLVMNASELSVSGQLHTAKAHLEEIESSIRQLKDKAAKPAAIAGFIDNAAMGLAVLFGFLIGTPLVLNGELWDVNLAILVLAPLAAFEGTAQLAPAAVQMVASASAASRVIDLMGGIEAVKNSLQALDNPTVQTADPKQDLTVNTQPDISPVLVAKNISIGWQNGPIVASGINLELHPGQALAIVGRSGIGKSTLLYTLAGLIPPLSGSLTLGGKDLSSISRKQITQNLVMTAEDAHVFNTSVLENIRVGRANVDETTATKLLQQAGLEQWLKAAPEGLGTNLGASGTALSGGERRRVLLARALATPAKLLLLDEPGEHLDAEMADHLVTDLLNTAKSGSRGVLLVTHRLSALTAADSVIVLGKDDDSQTSRVLYSGTHEQLVLTSDEYRWSLEQEKAYV